ncbi:MAG: hypothetical protein WCR21_07715, partial [Bacteroidota bacterium]
IKVQDGTKLQNKEVLDRVITMINLLREKNKKKILILGMDNHKDKTTVNVYQEIELSQKLGGNGFKVAFLAPHRMEDNNAKFAELVGSNRGVQIKYFAEYSEAENWLIS